MRTPYQLFQAAAMGMDMFVQDPIILLTSGMILPSKKFSAIRTLTNIGTVAVLWRIGGTPSIDSYHGVLKACSAVNDGTGGSVDLSRFFGDVYIAPITGTTCRVVAFQALPKEAQS